MKLNTWTCLRLGIEQENMDTEFGLIRLVTPIAGERTYLESSTMAPLFLAQAGREGQVNRTTKDARPPLLDIEIPPV